MLSQKHTPERFAEYFEFPDKTGFSLKDGTIFYYDKHGGWFDEFGNYYDKDGVPSEPVKSDSEEEEGGWEDEDERLNEFENYKDDLLEQYELYENEDPKEEKVRIYVKEYLDRMAQQINEYTQSEITFRISNLKYAASDKDLRRFFSEGNNISEKLISKIDLLIDEGGLNSGVAYMTVKSKAFAKECLKKHEEELLGRKVLIEVLKPKKEENPPVAVATAVAVAAAVEQKPKAKKRFNAHLYEK